MRQETRRGSARLILCVTCLLVTCSIARASEPEPTSPEPSMLRLTEGEIEAIYVSGEPYTAHEIALIVSELQSEHRAELQATAEDAAAEAVKPVLVENAGLTAERDSLRDSVAAARGRLVLGVLIAAVVGALIGAIAAR